MDQGSSRSRNGGAAGDWRGSFDLRKRKQARIEWQSRDRRRASFAGLLRCWGLQARRLRRSSPRSDPADDSGTGDLERLMRNKAMQARYDKWMNGIKARYGSTGRCCALRVELRVTLSSCRLVTPSRYFTFLASDAVAPCSLGLSSPPYSPVAFVYAFSLAFPLKEDLDRGP